MSGARKAANGALLRRQQQHRPLGAGALWQTVHARPRHPRTGTAEDVPSVRPSAVRSPVIMKLDLRGRSDYAGKK